MQWKIHALFGSLLAALGTTLLAAHYAPGSQSEFDSYRRPTEIFYPADNPYSREKSELGRMLFFDPILSGSNSRSCGTCHNPALAWGDGAALATGETRLSLRSPTLLDVAWTTRLGWDGKFHDLEAVAFGPITSPANMNLPEEALLRRLQNIPGYVDAFAAAFGSSGITRRNVELALATFQRSIVSGPAPFDRWIGGAAKAIGASAKRGFDLFKGKARCSGCHNGFSFTDGSFHDIGTAKDADIGRGRLFPTSVKLRYAFKTPTLRDVTRRAPYMHNGSVATLEEVIDLYDRGGVERPSRSVLIRPLGLTDAEKKDLIAFLGALDAGPKTVTLPNLPR